MRSEHKTHCTPFTLYLMGNWCSHKSSPNNSIQDSVVQQRDTNRLLLWRDIIVYIVIGMTHYHNIPQSHNWPQQATKWLQWGHKITRMDHNEAKWWRRQCRRHKDKTPIFWVFRLHDYFEWTAKTTEKKTQNMLVQKDEWTEKKCLHKFLPLFSLCVCFSSSSPHLVQLQHRRHPHILVFAIQSMTSVIGTDPSIHFIHRHPFVFYIVLSIVMVRCDQFVAHCGN